MALTRANDFDTGTVLTETKIEGEYDRIYTNGAGSLSSPRTADFALGAFIITGVGLGSSSAPAVSFNSDADTGIFSSAADTVDITAGSDRSASFRAATGTGVNYLTVTPAATGSNIALGVAGDANVGINIASAGTGANTVVTNSVERARWDASGQTMGTNMPVIAAVATGTPAIGALFRDNIVKGVARIDIIATVPTLETGTDYNAVSVSDDGVGRFTITWDRDFTAAGTNLTLGTAAGSTVCFVFCDSLAAGTTQVSTWSNNTTRVDTQAISVITLGAQ